MPFANFIGSHKRLWTKEKVIEGLKLAMSEIKGPLPCCDAVYSKLKKGKLNWPCAVRVLEYFGSMAKGWLVAGVDKKRITLKNIDWTDEEEAYLENYAGIYSLEQIGKYLRRSAAACKRRLYEKGITARSNQGYLSASELAKEYDCSCHRIRTLCRDGIIPGTFDKCRNRWQINPIDIKPEIEALLQAPKRTHKTLPTDKGDYYQRYNIHRTMINGKIVRIEDIGGKTIGK